MHHANDIPESVEGLPAVDHSIGSQRNALVLLEYGDYECPSCKEAEPLTLHLVSVFGDRLRFVYRHFPLVASHPHAQLAAEAAEAAAAQHRFWPMHHLLFENYEHLKLPALGRYAAAIGLDMTRFHAEMADRVYTQRVQEHRRSGEQLGVRGSPCFFLDGTVIDVSFGLEHLDAAVRAKLG
jgi:protein-disulfide isomerase